MPARLSVYAAEGPVAVHRLDDDREYVIGRGAECDVRVIDDRVSRRHASLGRGEDGVWRFRDLGSKNGITVESQRSSGGELAASAWLGLGGVPLRFETIGEEALRAAAEEEARRRRDGERLRRELDPAAGMRALLDRLLASVMSVVGADRGLLLLAGDDGELRLARIAGLAAEDLAGEAFSGSVGAVERALAEQRPIVCCDASADTLLGDRSSVQHGGIRALACLPLRVLDRAVGAVYADSREPGRALTELDVEILVGLAAQAAMALAVASLQDEVEGIAGALGTTALSVQPSWRRLTAVHRLLEPPS